MRRSAPPRNAKIIASAPGARSIRRRIRSRDGVSLSALYMERHVWVNLKSPRHHEEALRRDLLPRWRDTPLAEVTRREVSDLLGAIVQRGAGAQANQTKKYLSGIFSWGLQQGIAESNPAAGMKFMGQVERFSTPTAMASPGQ